MVYESAIARTEAEALKKAIETNIEDGVPTASATVVSSSPIEGASWTVYAVELKTPAQLSDE